MTLSCQSPPPTEPYVYATYKQRDTKDAAWTKLGQPSVRNPVFDDELGARSFWLLNHDPACSPAWAVPMRGSLASEDRSADFRPQTLKRLFPSCALYRDPARPRVLFADCRNSDLAGMFVFAESDAECRRLSALLP